LTATICGVVKRSGWASTRRPGPTEAETEACVEALRVNGELPAGAAAHGSAPSHRTAGFVRGFSIHADVTTSYMLYSRQYTA
jgi:hypothetical protein